MNTSRGIPENQHYSNENINSIVTAIPNTGLLCLSVTLLWQGLCSIFWINVVPLYVAINSVNICIMILNRLAEYDACEKLFREIMEQLTMRDRHPKASQAYGSVSANIRIRLKQYSREVLQLKSKVEDASRAKVITVEEAERRTRQIEVLQSRDIQLQKLYESHLNDFASSRANLLRSSGSAFADGGTTSWGADEDDDKPIDVQLSVDDLKTQQNKILQEQEKGLEELCKVIARQKEIGQTIGNEVEHQNEIIDSLADHLDRTDESLINKTRQVQSIGTKDRTCSYWMVIILLFIAIIVVALV